MLEALVSSPSPDFVLEPEPGKTKLLCPNANGGRNWPTTAFDPASYILYVPLVETCTDYSWTPCSAAQIAGAGFLSSAQSSFTPEIDNPPGGTTLWVFKLQGR